MFTLVVGGVHQWSSSLQSSHSCPTQSKNETYLLSVAIHHYYLYCRSVVVIGMVCSIIAVIIAIVATAVDGASYTVFNNYEACLSPSTGKVYGDQSYTTMLHNTCDFNGQSEPTSRCYCVSDDNDLCWEYDLANGNTDCNDILTTYPQLLSVSFAFALLCTLATLTYSLFTCVSSCCTTSKPSRMVYYAE